MSLRRTCGVAAALVLVFAATASSAAAKGGERLEFRLHPGNGYEVRVRAANATAVVAVSRDAEEHGLGLAESAYIARARTSATRLRATFGGLGRVSMRFHPRKTIRGASRRGCRGRDRSTRKFGSFVGTFRFRGENGYVRIRTHRVRGTVVSLGSRRCRGFFRPFPRRTAAIWRALSAPLPAVRESLDYRTAAKVATLVDAPLGEFSFLSASWRQGLAAESFGAIAVGELGSLYAATSVHTEKRLGVLRMALAGGSTRSFSVKDSLARATVRPPAPFSGSATFEHFIDGSKSWVGTLAVSFPGAPNVPLTGPLFEPKLRRPL